MSAATLPRPTTPRYRLRIGQIVCLFGLLGAFAGGCAAFDGDYVARMFEQDRATSDQATLPVPVHPRPSGLTGDWQLVFADEFNGSTLDTTKWSPCWFTPTCGKMNEVTTDPAHVRLHGGAAILTLASRSSGALISSDPHGGARPGFEFTTGYAEARVYFSGSGETVYNWPAWWVTGQSWPETGENDIAEGLGEMTVNYHSASGEHNQGQVPGVWTGAYHLYGIHRKAGKSDVYYDGKLVKSYATDDQQSPHYLVFNIGTKPSRQQVFGTRSELKVDYVRVWQESPR